MAGNRTFKPLKESQKKPMRPCMKCRRVKVRGFTYCKVCKNRIRASRIIDS